ncbi:MAG: radical SAM protein [Thermoplasmatales archaeon]|nr:radical SAM protein [Thermoplasmatales archaeon]
MKVNEIFYSIQGEGKDAGLPTIFIRLTGCNLRCRWCDAKYAYFEGKEMSEEEIIEKIKDFGSKRVCITGGEPLLQEGVYELIDRLIESGYEVSVETNGSISIRKLSEKNVIIKMDYKLPSSGFNKFMLEDNFNFLRSKDELKFIIMDREDYEFAKNIIRNKNIGCEIIMQPVWNKCKKLADWILEDKIRVRLSLQIHKIIWGNKRGK